MPSQPLATDRPQHPSNAFWREALLWLPALNLVAICGAAFSGMLSGSALLWSAGVLGLAELALLIARARRHRAGPQAVMVAILGNLGITATGLFLIVAAAISISCGADCDGLS